MSNLDQRLEPECPEAQRRYIHEVGDARRHPRYKLEVDICVYPRNSEVVRGHTVDISESGISAMLRVEVPLNELVRLEFSLPLGKLDVHALVRQREAFRYGFQFLEDSAGLDIIRWTCRELAMKEPAASAQQV